jgi:hypothetical protein
MPPASRSDAVIWFFWFRKIPFLQMDTLCISPMFGLPDPQPHDSTFSIQCALDRLPVQAGARHFKKPHFRCHAPSLPTLTTENSEEPAQ